MQRGVNLEPGIVLREVARTPGDIQRGWWEHLQRSWPLALSFLLSSVWLQTHIRPNSTHGRIHKVCSAWVSWETPIPKLGFPDISYLQITSSRLSFTPRQDWVKRGDAPMSSRQQNISWIILSRYFLWGGQHWWAAEDCRVKLGWNDHFCPLCRRFQPGLCKTHCRFL